MKKYLVCLAACMSFAAFVASGEPTVQATGVAVKAFHLRSDGVISNATAVCAAGEAVQPWTAQVVNSWKTVVESNDVFIATNYVVVATGTTTNRFGTTANSTNGTWSVTNVVTTAATTNYVSGIANLPPNWTCILTNGYTKSIPTTSRVPATGTVTLKNGTNTWAALTLVDGRAAETVIYDANKFADGGVLTVGTDTADTIILRIKYLTFR